MKKLIIICVHVSILFTYLPFKALAQKSGHTFVKGQVQSADGKLPLSGARISGNGHTATISDSDGRFILPVNADTGMISISYVGFKKANIPYDINKTIWMSITLIPMDIEIEEIEISTGFQTLPRDRATGSFTSLNEKQLNQQAGVDILSRLEGVSSGILFDKDGQRPAITVRGQSTINASTSPLIVVDNFPYSGNIENINPNNIDNITILKDAAAASIWGARAGNGVIVITTKKGRIDQPLSIDWNTNVTFKRKPDIYRSRSFIPSGDFIDLEQTLFNYGFYNAVLENTDTYPMVSPVIELLAKREGASQEEKTEIDQNIQSLRRYDVRRDIDRYIYTDELNQQYALNVQGGAEKLGYNFFVGHDRNQDYLSNTFHRISLRSQNSFRITKGLNLTAGVSYSQLKEVKGQTDYSNIKLSLTQGLFPYAKFADDNGNALPVVNTYRESFINNIDQENLLDWNYYPLEDYKYRDLRTSNHDFLANAGLDYQALSWLKLDAKYQYERQFDQGKDRYDEGSFFTNDMINKFTQIDSIGNVKYAVPRGSILDLSQSTLTSYNMRGQASVDRKWAENEFLGILGVEISEQQVDGASYRTYGYNDELGTINGLLDPVNSYPLIYGGSSTISTPNTFTGTINRTVSTYINASYTYMRRYILSTSARKDKSNLFGVNTNQKGRPFWSLGLSWDISKENFYSAGIIHDLKIRSTFGYSGNLDNSLSALTTIRYGSVNPFTGFKQATVNKFENPELRWEKTGILNLGVDIGMFDHRLTGSIEYYHKNGTDLLGDAVVDITAGLRTPTVRKNIASMKGSGVDIVLNSKNLIHKLKWNSSLLFSFNRNKVNEYYLNTYQGSTYVIAQGNMITPIPNYPVYSILSYRSAGLDSSTGDPVGYLDGATSKDYSAITGTGTEVKDLAYHGSAVPVYFGAIGNTFSWRNITLTLNFTYKLGHYFRKNSIHYGNLFNGWVQHEDYLNRWKEPGDESTTDIPSLVYPNDANRDSFYNGSEKLVRKADHIRLQYLNLSYRINHQNSKNLLFRNLMLNMNISNIGLLWTSNKEHIDPDYPYGISPTRSINVGIRSIL